MLDATARQDWSCQSTFKLYNHKRYHMPVSPPGTWLRLQESTDVQWCETQPRVPVCSGHRMGEAEGFSGEIATNFGASLMHGRCMWGHSCTAREDVMCSHNSLLVTWSWQCACNHLLCPQSWQKNPELYGAGLWIFQIPNYSFRCTTFFLRTLTFDPWGLFIENNLGELRGVWDNISFAKLYFPGGWKFNPKGIIY